jgi:hypothetical protein
MTTIITRLYSDAATARGVASALMANGHDQDTIDVIGKEGAGGAAERMRAARVAPAAAAAYADAVAAGKALIVVRAPFAPMGAARNAMKIVDRTPSIKVGVADENAYIRETPSMTHRSSVLPGTTFFMSNPHRSMSHGHIFGAKLLSAHKQKRSAIAGGKHISRLFWPMRLISAPRARHSAMHGTWLFSRMFGLPTVI